MSTHNLCFEQKCEIYQIFFIRNVSFLVVKFSVHLNKHVFIMSIYLNRRIFVIKVKNIYRGTIQETICCAVQRPT